MSELKCPFCGDEMKLTSLYMDGNHRYSHKYIGGLRGGKDRCPFDGETLPLRALQEIHRTRKALGVAVDALKEIDETRSVANHKIGTQNKTLNSGIVFCWTTPDEVHNTLEQITALEQKDVK